MDLPCPDGRSAGSIESCRSPSSLFSQILAATITDALQLVNRWFG
jgi:hypothetical protein